MYDDLIGRPYALPCDPPHSFDCWELAKEVRKRLGLHTHEYETHHMDRMLSNRMDFNKPDPEKWVQLVDPIDGCLVGFGRRYILHCGVYLDRKVIHANQVKGLDGSVSAHTLEVAQMYLGNATFWEAK